MRTRIPKMLRFLGFGSSGADDSNKAEKLPDVPGTH
jgi:hypothetical protein